MSKDKELKMEMNDEQYKTLEKLIDAGEAKSVLDFFNKEGLNIDAKGGDFSRSALHCALRKGHTEIAKILIEKGANINIFPVSSDILLDAAIELCDEHLELIHSSSQAADKVNEKLATKPKERNDELKKVSTLGIMSKASAMMLLKKYAHDYADLQRIGEEFAEKKNFFKEKIDKVVEELGQHIAKDQMIISRSVGGSESLQRNDIDTKPNKVLTSMPAIDKLIGEEVFKGWVDEAKDFKGSPNERIALLEATDKTVAAAKALKEEAKNIGSTLSSSGISAASSSSSSNSFRSAEASRKEQAAKGKGGRG